MNHPIADGLLLGAAAGSGLIGGVFFAFSSFVMAALHRIPASAGIAAMQAINVTVINPGFLLGFFGTAVLCGLLLLGCLTGHVPAETALVSGCLLYAIGTFGVTIACNVPRNDRLAELDADAVETKQYWEQYMTGWTRWNHVRTVCAVLAAILLTVAHSNLSRSALSATG